MIAESGYFDVVLFGCLEDGKIVIYFIGFVVDEDFYFFSGEGSIWFEGIPNQLRS